MGYFAFVFTTLYLGLSIYLFYHLRRMKIAKSLFWSLLVFFTGSFFLGALANWIEIPLSKTAESWFRASVFACFVALIMSTPILFLRDILGGVKKVYFRLTSKEETSVKAFRSRRDFLSSAAVTVGAVPFTSLLAGIGGKYNYKIHHYELTFSNLPKAFDGFKVVQLSDLHLGSFDDLDAVAEGLNLVNEQQPDLLLFTGDMVNNKSYEADPFISMLVKLKAPYGKYSVLGNHDYATYNDDFDSEQARADVERLIGLQEQMGFRNLRNESIKIISGDDYFQLVGVENWGTGRFLKAGDLNRASKGLNPDVFTLLMSHDPSHWEAEVIGHNHHFDLTLSGHTHGFQYGIEVAGLQWSPSKFRYPQWAGMYEKDERLINVNRGFGFLGYPGRFGIWPEITVITLKSA
jgi:predicted MPP superfamily phosphohydrolase